jgi:hypothetical protein
MSPGKDITTRRDLSPRRERRYMTTIRAPSPRRALYHNPPLSMGQYLHAEPIVLGPPVSTTRFLFLYKLHTLELPDNTLLWHLLYHGCLS